jgi:hypothetical protein
LNGRLPNQLSDIRRDLPRRPRFPEPLKETNTDTPLMHNVYDRIGTELQQSKALNTLSIISKSISLSSCSARMFPRGKL